MKDNDKKGKSIFSENERLFSYSTSSGLRLMKFNKGYKDNGFKLCLNCGNTDVNNESHPTPYSYYKNKESAEGYYSCKNQEVQDNLELACRFDTDYFEIIPEYINDEINIELKNDEFWLSVLYALIEGCSRYLEIERRELDGLVRGRRNKNGQMIKGFILIDSVPGGAGHVKNLARLNNNNMPELLLGTLKEAYKVVADCELCIEDESCYGCLRNYDNQFEHNLLVRKPAIIYLGSLLERIKQAQETGELRID